jgi:23S rRNA (adenine2503-C2)-methyltransferase
MPARYDVTREELAQLLDGEPAFRVRQVWDGLHRRVFDPFDMTDLSVALRIHLDDTLTPALTPERESVSNDGETVKWLWRLHDGKLVETVLMHYDDRTTVCVSSQAGCAMACGFCATGQAGFDRNLSTGEIVEQVARAIQRARPRRVTNIVFMGMGEPLANYDRTWGAVRRLHDEMGISARHLTVSTVGIIPGIRRLATEDLPVNLAVSLHAANNVLRDELVPINRRYPLPELREACAEYLEAKGRRLSFEWALIDGVNDRPIDAQELAAYARPLGAHVNLIPLNPTPGWGTPGSPPAKVTGFRDSLRALGVNATVRRNRGTDIDAACGQLRATALS